MEKRKKRTVYTNESVVSFWKRIFFRKEWKLESNWKESIFQKKTGKSAVAKSNSQRFRLRNTKEEDNLKKLMENKQKVGIFMSDLSKYNCYILFFLSKIKKDVNFIIFYI